MESLPDDVLIQLFSLLNLKEMLACASVCRRWSIVCSDNHFWKNVFYCRTSTAADRSASTVRKRCASLAAITSWKFAFRCFTDISRQKAPSFWDDVDSWIQPRKKFSTVNELFARMLELKLAEGGRFSFPHDLEPRRNATLLSSYFTMSMFLLKLKDIAAVPVAASWLRSRPRITTRLIERLCDESSEAAPISVDDTCTHWWPVVSSEAYEECFVTPVQRAVIKALESSLCASTSDALRMRSNALDGMSVAEWVQNLTVAQFWTPAAKEDVAILIDRVRTKIESSPPSLPQRHSDLMSWNIPLQSAKNHAYRLSQRTFQLFGRVPHSELVIYLSVPDAQVRSLPLAQQISRYCESLKNAFTSGCFSQQYSESYKVTLIKHTIKVCIELKNLKDYLSLETLISAIRESIDQPNRTKVSWKHTSTCREYSDKWKELEDLMSASDVYRSYFRYIGGLKVPYVPYLPAHRQLCRVLMKKRAASPSFNSSSSIAEKLFVHIHHSQLWPLVSVEHIQDYSL